MRPARLLSFAFFTLASCSDNGTVLTPDAAPDVTTKDVATVDVANDVTTQDAPQDVVSDAPLDCGDAGLVQCGSACSDLQTDAHNCGFCGHDCGTGTCAKGMCPVQTLASNLMYPFGIAVDATSFYVTEQGTLSNTGDVLKCPVAGCPTTPTPMTATIDNPGDIAVDATNVYWLNRGGIASAGGSVMKCPVAGCGTNDANRVTLVKSITFPVGMTLDATNVYYNQTGPNPGFNGSLEYCAIAGCAQKPKTILTGQAHPTSVAVNATKAWIIAGGGTKVVEGTIASSGTGTLDETDMTAGYGSIILAGASLLWSDGNNGTIRACGQTGCNMNSKALIQNLQSPGPIAIDTLGLYILDQGASTLLYCKDIQSCTTPIVLADKLDQPAGIALGPGYVYWTNSGSNDATGTVNRVAR